MKLEIEQVKIEGSVSAYKRVLDKLNRDSVAAAPKVEE